MANTEKPPEVTGQRRKAETKRGTRREGRHERKMKDQWTETARETGDQDSGHLFPSTSSWNLLWTK